MKYISDRKKIQKRFHIFMILGGQIRSWIHPDPDQNETDPKNCLEEISFFGHLYFFSTMFVCLVWFGGPEPETCSCTAAKHETGL